MMNKYFLLICLSLQVLVVTAQNVKTDTTGKSSNTGDRFSLLISKASDAVLNEDFDQAKSLYSEALVLKPTDAAVLRMLENVNSSIRALDIIKQRNIDLKRKADINILLNQAQSDVMARNYESAKLHYTQVLAMQPVKSQEDFVNQKLKAIDFALANSKTSNSVSTSQLPTKTPVKDEPTAKVKNDQKVASTERAQDFDRNTSSTPPKVTSTAATPMIEEKKQAITRESVINNQSAPRNADAAKTNVEPGNKQLSTNSNTTQTKSELIKEEQKPLVAANNVEKNKPQAHQSENIKAASEPGKNVRFETLVESAIKAINTGNLQVALQLYNELLALNPTPQQENAIYSEIIAIRRNLEKGKPGTTETSMSKNVITVEKPISQVGMPSTDAAKSVKNGAITNTSKTLPTTQIIEQNESAKTTRIVDNPVKSTNSQSSNLQHMGTNKDDIEFSKKMMSQSSLFYLTDSSNHVKLTFQGIATKGSSLFLKFMIQNSSNVDFNIGSLQLSYIQNSGQLNKLNPRYIVDKQEGSSKKEFTFFVVADNQHSIEPNEVLILELEDRAKQTQLSINISGENFSKKTARAF